MRSVVFSEIVGLLAVACSYAQSEIKSNDNFKRILVKTKANSELLFDQHYRQHRLLHNAEFLLALHLYGM